MNLFDGGYTETNYQSVAIYRKELQAHTMLKNNSMIKTMCVYRDVRRAGMEACSYTIVRLR